MKQKNRLGILLALLCLTVLVMLPLAGCNGDTTPTEPVVETTEPTVDVTDEPTEAPTQESTETPTEEPTEPATEEPTEAPTEAPTESSGTGGSVNNGTGGSYTPQEPEATEPEPTEPPEIEVAAPGSESNVYFENVAASAEFSTVEISAGETVHYALKTPGSYLELNESGMELTVNGQLCPAEEGVIRIQLPADDKVVTRLQFKNIGNEAKRMDVAVLDAEGSQTNPIALESLNFPVNLAEGNANGMYYSWTADSDGELKLRLKEVGGELTVMLGDATVKLSETENGVLELPVAAGDVVSIQATALPDEAGNYPAAQLQAIGYVAIYCDLNVEQIPYAGETVSVPAGKSVIYRITGAGGHILSIPSENAYMRYCDQSYAERVKLNWADTPAQVEIFNKSNADQAFPLEVLYSEGHLENPKALMELGEIPVTVDQGMSGYYYSYIAQTPGVVNFSIWEYPELEGKTDIVVENKTAQVTESLWSTDENGDLIEGSSVMLNVNAGDELLIGVMVEKPEDQQVSFVIYGDHFGSEENPIPISYPGFTASVPAGTQLYYCGYNMQDIIFSLQAENVAVSHNDTEYTPAEGMIRFPVVAAGRMPAIFGIENTGAEDAAYSVVLSYPVGHMENPDKLVLGTTQLTREAGKFDYCLQFTAPRAGKLVLTFDAASQWMYVVDNLTQMVYGDTQYSDSEPLTAVTELTVAADDVIQLRVNTYDPEIPWETPAGTVSFDAAYVTGPTTITAVTVATQAVLISKETAQFNGEFYGLILNVTGNQETVVTYDGKDYTPDSDGTIAVEFPESGSEKLSFSIHNGSSGGMTALIQFSTKNVGSAVNPQKITAGTFSMVQNKEGGADYYYSFTSTKAGYITLTFETDQDAIYIINDRIYRYVPDNPTYQVYMQANKTITIAVNTYDPTNPMVSPKGIVDFTVKFK